MKRLLSIILSFVLMLSMIMPVVADNLQTDADLDIDGNKIVDLGNVKPGDRIIDIVKVYTIDRTNKEVTYPITVTFDPGITGLSANGGTISGTGKEKGFVSEISGSAPTVLGPFSITVRWNSNAGNVNNNPATITYTGTVIEVTPADNTAPTIILTQDPVNWTNQDVTISTTITDASGVAEQKWAMGEKTVDYFATEGTAFTGTTFTVSANGVYTVYARDTKGNEGVSTITIENIDKVNPTITGAATTQPNANGWYNSDVIVHYTASDELSGIASVTPDQTISEEKLDNSVTGIAFDKAGNSSSATVSGINIDKTVPKINAPADGQVFIQNSSDSPTWDATDSLSGIDTKEITGFSTSSVGTRSYTITATDKAGNSNIITRSYRVIYNFSGFFKPIETGVKVVNTAKAGSAIPVKFSLNGNQGMQIFEGGYPKSVIASITNAGLVLDPIETYVSTVTSGGSTLSYDSATDQYIYVWKTDKAWSGYRALIIRFADGEEYSAVFKFSK